MILRKDGLFLDSKCPCSSVVEQYPEKVCVVCAIQTKGIPPQMTPVTILTLKNNHNFLTCINFKNLLINHQLI